MEKSPGMMAIGQLAIVSWPSDAWR